MQIGDPSPFSQSEANTQADWTQGDSFPLTDFSAFSVFNSPAPSQQPIPFTGRIASESEELPASLFEPRSVTTAQLNLVHQHFEQANERADIVLAINKDRADACANALGLHRGQNSRESNESARKLIGQSGGVDKQEGKRGRGKARKEKENIEGEDEGGEKKVKYTGAGLIILARAAVDVEPFLAPQGGKGPAWQKVVNIMKLENEFRNTTLNASGAQHKAEDLVAFKKVRVYFDSYKATTNSYIRRTLARTRK
jgi:hypothetical protein